MFGPDYDEGDKGELTLADYRRDAERLRNKLITAEAKIRDLKSKLQAMTHCEALWRRKAKEWHAQMVKAECK